MKTLSEMIRIAEGVMQHEAAERIKELRHKKMIREKKIEREEGWREDYRRSIAEADLSIFKTADEMGAYIQAVIERIVLSERTNERKRCVEIAKELKTYCEHFDHGHMVIEYDALITKLTNMHEQ